MKTFHAAVGVAAVLVSSVVFAFENEPDGFRGIKWGTPFATNASEMTNVAKVHGGHTVYHRKRDKMQIGGAELNSIGYGYFEGRFYTALIKTDVVQKRALKMAFTSQFGKPEQKNEYIEKYHWAGKKTFIQFSCEITDCTVSISSVEMLDRIVAQEKKEAAGAKRDF